MAGKTPSYVPAVAAFNFDTVKQPKRVVVIGSGCAGLGAAWHLNRAGADVQLFESDSRIGGHANTVTVDGVDVDTGFMVYNSLNYPNLVGLFDELGISGDDTTMGFSVSMDDGKFEWCGDSLSGLMATPSNLYNPSFYLMMSDILRFNKEANKSLSLSEDHPRRKQTVGQFLKENRFSDSFAKYYLVPMTAAIWSASTEGIMNFPAITLFAFLNNHLLLQVSGHINWKTPSRRSKEYVKAICSELGDRVHINRPVAAIRRGAKVACGAPIAVIDTNGVETPCDEVVFACHPDQALRILADEVDEEEAAALGCFKYSSNTTYVHSDEALMPKSKSAWTCWNYMGKSDLSDQSKPVYVTYWLNKLQNLSHPRNIFVSLNPRSPPAADKILAEIEYSHPQYTGDSVKAQRRVAAMQGKHGAYFCGAWMGYGFHEDGFRSGIEVAMAITGVPAPWVKKWGQCAMIPAPKAALAMNEQTSITSSLTGLVTRPLVWTFETLCKHLIFFFLQQGFSRGVLTFTFPDGSSRTFTGTMDLDNKISVRVMKPWFWVRLALEADLGLSRSYIAGEWEVEDTGPNSDGLTKFLSILLDNMPTGKTRVSGGLDAGQLISAWAGSAINMLWYRLTMDNSIANSRSNIHAHYDLSNELFKTFLDKEHMMYSSALFQTELLPATPAKLCSCPCAENPDLKLGRHTPSRSLKFVDSLESAQLRKIDALLSRLEPLGPDHTFLDIGFGWGGICLRAAEKYGCQVYGITLSTEQKALAEEKVAQKGLGHLITFELVDYREFSRRRAANGDRKFDRIVSCEMIEAVGHNHLQSFFATVDSLLHTEGIFVMQAITMPDSRYPTYVKSADLCNTIIFPGGCCPSMSALLNAMALKSTLHLENVVNINLHYAETLRQWRTRFNAAFPRVLELGFDDTFLRLWNLYLCYCEAGFQAQVINLQILTFSRPGNPNMVHTRAIKCDDFL